MRKLLFPVKIDQDRRADGAITDHEAYILNADILNLEIRGHVHDMTTVELTGFSNGVSLTFQQFFADQESKPQAITIYPESVKNLMHIIAQFMRETGIEALESDQESDQLASEQEQEDWKDKYEKLHDAVLEAKECLLQQDSSGALTILDLAIPYNLYPKDHYTTTETEA